MPGVGAANAAGRSLITVPAAQRMDSLLDGRKYGLEAEIQDEGPP